ncbi:hypothetical protein SETIT_5G394100v2 [Setaria italica]|uniref:Terpene synthase N-terminal domain-containing protein n=1 Tax=Setaria italica TaxID=4555 RepID=A0A368RDP9_SETIT|nr:hypothetical protein SETIT_5G394100v2 [Setaria italica]
MRERADELKGEVRQMFGADRAMSVSAMVNLVDELERLGVDNHFREEISADSQLLILTYFVRFPTEETFPSLSERNIRYEKNLNPSQAWEEQEGRGQLAGVLYEGAWHGSGGCNGGTCRDGGASGEEDQPGMYGVGPRITTRSSASGEHDKDAGGLLPSWQGRPHLWP